MLGFYGVPEGLEGLVEKISRLQGVETGGLSVERGGMEAKLGKGKESAGGLELEEVGSPCCFGVFQRWKCGGIYGGDGDDLRFDGR